MNKKKLFYYLLLFVLLLLYVIYEILLWYEMTGLTQLCIIVIELCTFISVCFGLNWALF